MIAKDFMTKDVVSCRATQTVEEAATLMVDKGFSAIPVVDAEGLLVGILTQSDFISKEIKVPRAMVSIRQLLGVTHYEGDIEEIYASAKNRKLEDVMTKHPKTITPEASLNSVVGIMESRGLKRIPVVEDQKLVGIITRRDLIRAFKMSRGKE